MAAVRLGLRAAGGTGGVTGSRPGGLAGRALAGAIGARPGRLGGLAGSNSTNRNRLLPTLIRASWSSRCLAVTGRPLQSVGGAGASGSRWQPSRPRTIRNCSGAQGPSAIGRSTWRPRPTVSGLVGEIECRSFVASSRRAG